MIDLSRLRNAPLFREFSEPAIEEIVALGREEFFAAGTDIFSEGEAGRYLYIVIDGTVSIYCRGKHIAKCRNYEAFGEMATLHQRPRSATARASSDVKALAYGEPEVKRLLESPHAIQFLLNVIGLLGKRLETGNAWIAHSLESQRR